MVSSQPMTTRFVLRVLSLGALLVTASWCLKSFTHEPILAFITTASVVIGLFSQGRSRDYECAFSLFRPIAFALAGLTISSVSLFFIDLATESNNILVDALILGALSIGLLVGTWLSFEDPSIERRELVSAIFEGVVFGAFLLSAPAWTGDPEVLRSFPSMSKLQCTAVSAGLGALVGGLGWPAFVVVSADLKGLVHWRLQGREVPGTFDEEVEPYRDIA